jgi:hypothetical protein
MSFLSSIFREERHDTTGVLPTFPPLPRTNVGVVCNAITPRDVDLLQWLGTGRIRLTWCVTEPQAVLSAKLNRVAPLRVDVVVVVNGIPANWNPADIAQAVVRAATLWPSVTFQLENEVDRERSGVEAGMQFSVIRRLVRRSVPRARIVPPGLSSSVTAAWLRNALSHGLGEAGVVCLHAYVPDDVPLGSAVSDRLLLAAKSGFLGTVWLTELGHDATCPEASDLNDALDTIPPSVVAYLYALRCRPTDESDKGLAEFDSFSPRPACGAVRDYVQGLPRW